MLTEPKAFLTLAARKCEDKSNVALFEKHCNQAPLCHLKYFLALPACSTRHENTAHPVHRTSLQNVLLYIGHLRKQSPCRPWSFSLFKGLERLRCSDYQTNLPPRAKNRDEKKLLEAIDRRCRSKPLCPSTFGLGRYKAETCRPKSSTVKATRQRASAPGLQCLTHFFPQFCLAMAAARLMHSTELSYHIANTVYLWSPLCPLCILVSCIRGLISVEAAPRMGGVDKLVSNSTGSMFKPHHASFLFASFALRLTTSFMVSSKS